MKELKFIEGIFWIFLTSIIYFSFGVTISKFIDIFIKKIPFFSDDHKKSKFVLIIEVSILIGIIATSIYIMRLFVMSIIKNIYGGMIPGTPDKYSILIVAPTLFSLQSTIIHKLKHIWDHDHSIHILEKSYHNH